jgi:hypothetical protein
MLHNSSSEGANPLKLRRHLTFSLRTLFILLTASAVWLGVVVNRARQQREAIKAIEALGGTVVYDWELSSPSPADFDPDATPPGPDWLRRLVGDEFFQDLGVVHLAGPQASALSAIPHLQRLRTPRILWPNFELTAETRAMLQESLPGCEIW